MNGFTGIQTGGMNTHDTTGETVKANIVNQQIN
jgi:hypothetical protein